MNPFRNKTKHQRDRESNKERWDAQNFVPTKNRVMCPQCDKMKQLFNSEAEAERFIKFNKDNLPYGGDSLRVYWCSACGGFHFTSKTFKKSYLNSTERIISMAFADGVSTKYYGTDSETAIFWNKIPEVVKRGGYRQFKEYVELTFHINIDSSAFKHGFGKMYTDYHTKLKHTV